MSVKRYRVRMLFIHDDNNCLACGEPASSMIKVLYPLCKSCRYKTRYSTEYYPEKPGCRHKVVGHTLYSDHYTPYVSKCQAMDCGAIWKWDQAIQLEVMVAWYSASKLGE